MAEIRADGIDVVGCREGKHEKDADFLKKAIANEWFWFKWKK